MDSGTGIPVVLEITDRHIEQQEESTRSFLCCGTLYKSEKDTPLSWRIVYAETTHRENARVTLDVEETIVHVSRRGSLPVDLALEEGVRHKCFINAPFGACAVGCYARHVHVDAKKMRLRLRYMLDFGVRTCSENEMTIHIRPAGGKFEDMPCPDL
jgi:uncharacterized beta-barrel protein YwiB (DUF1934 family)